MPINLEDFEKLRNVRGVRCNWEMLISMLEQPTRIKRIVELSRLCTYNGKPLTRWVILKRMREFAAKGKVRMKMYRGAYYVVKVGGERNENYG